MAEAKKRNSLVSVIIGAAAIAAIGGLVYWFHVMQQRERQAFEKIEVLRDEHSSVGQSYVRTLQGIESLRVEFRKLVDDNPRVPTGQLQALADEATTEVIESEGLSQDVDLVVNYVADLDSCIAAGNCDPKVATGHESPLAALRNWEQWYRPYLERRQNSTPELASRFYSYLRRAPA